mgnify:CR=1 FL=1
MFGAILLRGQPTAEQRQLLATPRHPQDPLTFLPEPLGLPRLDTRSVVPQPKSLPDHGPRHEFQGLRPGAAPALGRLVVWGTMATFARVFGRTQRRVQPVVTRTW